jgi:hypothetical protein
VLYVHMSRTVDMWDGEVKRTVRLRLFHGKLNRTRHVRSPARRRAQSELMECGLESNQAAEAECILFVI